MATKKRRAKKGEAERLPPVLASDVGLRCKQSRQVRPGRFEPCLNPATCYIAGAGDACDDHPRSKDGVRYATARQACARAA